MILDSLKNAARYNSLHPAFGEAFAWLQQQDVSKLPSGRTDIAGDRLYVNVIREGGRGTEKARFEAHRQYIDIQVITEGSDLIGWTHLTPHLKSLGYDLKKDLEFYTDTPGLWIPVPAGHFAIFFPEDAHAPMAGTESMVKVVIKVAV